MNPDDMPSFSERFNEWLRSQGKEPVSEELAEILDTAARETLEDLRESRDQIVKAGQFFMAELTGQLPKGDATDEP